MYSIAWPNMFSSKGTKLVSDHDATVQNLKLMLLSDRGSLFGDPYFGTLWKRLLFDQNNIIIRDIIIDDILTSIQTFMPQLLVQRKDITITSDKYSIYISIKATNLLDYQIDLYNIKLTGDEVE